METEIKKWGNSLAVRLPKPMAKQISIKDGSRVNLVLKDDRIEIIPKEPIDYSLDEMLMMVNEDNIHKEYDNGKSVGLEL